MIIFFVIFMATLTVFNFMVTRSIYYPATFFTALWTVYLSALFLSGDFFYSISDMTCAIYSLGVFMFSSGSLLVFFIYQKKPATELPVSKRDTTFANRCLDIGLVVLLLAFPFYWRHLQQLGTIMDIEDFWISLRAQTSSGDKSAEGFGIFAYLAALSTFLSWAAYYENNGTLYKRFRAYSIISVSLAYHVITVSRLGAMITVFGLIGITVVRNGRIRLKSLLLGITIFVLIFSAPALILNKGGSLDSSISENIVSISESFQLYALGGLVAFDDVVNHPDNIESNWYSLRFFTTIANSLGANYDLPPSTLEYTLTPLPTNVYTIYFPYYEDYGLIGIVIIMFIMGALTTFVFIWALNGGPQAGVLYGLIFASLILTSVSEPFLTTISYWIQAIAFTYFIYKLPYLWHSRESTQMLTRKDALPLS